MRQRQPRSAHDNRIFNEAQSDIRKRLGAVIHQHARSGFHGMAGQRHAAAEQRDRGFHDWINLADGRRANARRAERANERMNAVPETVDPRNFIGEKFDEKNVRRHG